MKRKIAVLAGGYSGEFDVSIKSAAMIMTHLDTDLFEPYLVELKPEAWTVKSEQGEFAVDRNDFSFRTMDQEHVKFDYAYIIIHGTPGEDGTLQGYLDMISVPYNTGSVLAQSGTFNKALTQRLAKYRGIQVAEHMIFRLDDCPAAEEVVEQLGLPCFVKPTESGSSIGVAMVEKVEGILPAIKAAAEINPEIIIESRLVGRELACGVYNLDGEVHCLPITEVISPNAFFDYEAKYANQETQEITPADISEEIAKCCQAVTKEVYELFNCKGIARADFFLNGEELYLVEINSVPGMSKESIVPKQIKAANLDLKNVLSQMILSDLKRK